MQNTHDQDAGGTFSVKDGVVLALEAEISVPLLHRPTGIGENRNLLERLMKRGNIEFRPIGSPLLQGMACNLRISAAAAWLRA